MTHIAVIRYGDADFWAYFGTKAELERKFQAQELAKHETVWLKRAPPHIANALRGNKLAGRELHLHKGQLGYIRYVIDGSHATTSSVYPKNNLKKDFRGSGLGYYVEHACAVALKKQGIKTIGSSKTPGKPRQGQLTKAGLPIATTVPIDDWIAGMKRGMRRSSVRKPALQRAVLQARRTFASARRAFKR
ncbi:MAG: hypothetical protein AABW54_00520 [Candidatus Micrarchaeota archaeon]